MNKTRNLKSVQAVVGIMCLLILACGQFTATAPTLTLVPSPTLTNTVTSTPTKAVTPIPTNTVTPISGNTDIDERYVESGGGFSYVPPVGWQVVEFPGLKYKIVMGEETANFSPSLNFVDETYTGSLDSYATANLEAIKKFFKNVKIISQKNFKTNNDEIVIKVITENTQNENRLHQTFYFFDAGNKKFVITYTRLPGIGEENDVLVDQCITTFRIDQ